ncbi:hypothetical protein I5772_12320 [Klebsiella pneumoniae]|uniref:hypothetical protein n=1 Tax=Klebsiella pneumoniae TaxID=573 RepID=UPI0018CA13BE|nr:hypothetical protein [Klebsiella pneumoniae]MBG9431403.1 hypothetical protein [Klebsiella pneumoniae]HDI2368863.1 hypothetical protein [Klebsiella pneumoniae]HDI2416207.1 hypothetical protein [Klebsiella pneumoniae]HDI2430263.1 hypothetical protein [Klebsiella pneumoniae]HDI2751518.1 hypothetical protein [Klebsiella pneumoniae]
MTITLQAVNELIASLESAGELSIKETNVMALAKAFKQLAEENVGLRPLIAENWNMRDLLRQLMAGRPGGVYFNKWEKLIVRVLNETPATDRIIAGIKADGVEEFAAKLRIPGDDQFFDALAKGVAIAADDFAKQLREGADK